MRGMPFHLQGKGVLEIAAATEAALWRSTTSVGSSDHNRINSSGSVVVGKKEGGFEPRSVLDHGRSPSPPTSSSTLSSSLGGGSTDSAGVAAVSDNPPHKWLPSSQDTSSAAPGEAATGGGSGLGGRKDEWSSELQPIPAGLEIGLVGGDKCGLGMEDWESMLSEPAAAGATASSPGHEQSFLRWIMGDIEDPSSVVGLKQPQHHHTMPSQGPLDFDGGGGFGLVDPPFGFEGLGGGLGSTVGHPFPCPAPVSSGGGFPGYRIPPVPASPGLLPGLKLPSFCDNPNSNPIFSTLPPPNNGLPLPLSLPQGMLFQEPAMEEKPQLFGPHLLLNQQQVYTVPNSTFFLPLPPYAAQHQHQHQHPLLPPQPKRHHSMVDPSCQVSPEVPFLDPAQDLFLRRHQQEQQQGFGNLHGLPYQTLQQRSMMKPKLAAEEAAAAAAQQQQHHSLVEQLFKAADLVDAGNSVNARGILARLNHQLSPIGKPFLRSAFYCKEALQHIIGDSPTTNHHHHHHPSSSPPPLPQNPSAAPATPLDVVLKLSAYKAFSEISPIVQFANFTCIQALLEELNGCSRIHILDFDIEVGGQWSSFIQELAQRRCNATGVAPSLKITAFASPSSHHPLELALTQENLSLFASDLNIPFEFEIQSIDSFDQASIHSLSSGSGEAIAVNLPMGSAHPTVPTLLRLVKQLSPKIVISVDHGCDRSDLSFAQHFVNALQSLTVLLDSIEAVGTNPDVANKIERFLLQPRIESAVMGRHCAAKKMLPWRTSFASAGFIPVPFSNSTETQAEWLLKRIQVSGFHVEKRQSSLLLCWQRRELVSVSAWKC